MSNGFSFTTTDNFDKLERWAVAKVHVFEFLFKRFVAETTDILRVFGLHVLYNHTLSTLIIKRRLRPNNALPETCPMFPLKPLDLQLCLDVPRLMID
jgi:hypothetical protein